MHGFTILSGEFISYSLTILIEKKIRVQTKDGKERYVSLREIIKGTGNFDLQKKIGEGRFGEVYRVDQTSIIN